jgi:CheY-like chemotaxis protein
VISSQTPIALAEDNDDDVFFVRRALKAAEMDNPLIVLKDGRQAVDYLAGQGEYADRAVWPLAPLLLLDLKLRMLSGFQVLDWIRSQSDVRALVVVVLSTSGESKDVERAYLAGANAYLVKPSGAENAARQLRAIKQFWLDQNCFVSG